MKIILSVCQATRRLISYHITLQLMKRNVGRRALDSQAPLKKLARSIARPSILPKAHSEAKNIATELSYATKFAVKVKGSI